MRFTFSLIFSCVCVPAALGQYSSSFESLNVSAAGTAVTGQDGYYIPAGTASVDFFGYPYAGNGLGIPANPTGGSNFIAGEGPGGGTFARAQRDLSYGAGVWTLAFDVLGTFNGTLPTANNMGSVSIQPFPGAQNFIALAVWSDLSTATNWDANYIWYDSAGTQLTEAVADPAFQNLDIDRWYRWETDFDLSTNEIVQVRITDLVAGTTAMNNPIGRYLEGGLAPSAPPTGFRFFGGGGVAGNLCAFDNLSISGGSSGIGTNYCMAAANSTGSAGSMSATGSLMVAGNNVTLGAASLPPNQFGIFVVSRMQGLVVGAGGTSNGNLCLSGTLGRYSMPGQILSTGATGEFSLAIDLALLPQGGAFAQAMPGETWNFQAWHRDGVGLGSNFTDGLAMTFQ